MTTTQGTGRDTQTGAEAGGSSHADSVAGRLDSVRRAIAETASACGRGDGAVTLVAVSKTHPAEAVEEALAAGQRVFGENRVQEAKAKFPALKERFPELELHLIGPLQTNKVKDAIALFDVIQTLDRPKLAEALAEEMAKSGRRPRCLIEVNTGEEPQKAGIAPAEVEAFLADCRDRLAPPETGLPLQPIAERDGWCDAPEDPAYNRPVIRPYPASHEEMWRDDHVYDVVVVMGHNDDPVVPGMGSAVFLHLVRPDRAPTAGCVALAPDDMLRLLKDCGPGSALSVAGPAA